MDQTASQCPPSATSNGDLNQRSSLLPSTVQLPPAPTMMNSRTQPFMSASSSSSARYQQNNDHHHQQNNYENFNNNNNSNQNNNMLSASSGPHQAIGASSTTYIVSPPTNANDYSPHQQSNMSGSLSTATTTTMTAQQGVMFSPPATVFSPKSTLSITGGGPNTAPPNFVGGDAGSGGGGGDGILIGGVGGGGGASSITSPTPRVVNSSSALPPSSSAAAMAATASSARGGNSNMGNCNAHSFTSFSSPLSPPTYERRRGGSGGGGRGGGGGGGLLKSIGLFRSIVLTIGIFLVIFNIYIMTQYGVMKSNGGDNGNSNADHSGGEGGGDDGVEDLVDENHKKNDDGEVVDNKNSGNNLELPPPPAANDNKAGDADAAGGPPPPPPVGKRKTKKEEVDDKNQKINDDDKNPLLTPITYDIRAWDGYTSMDDIIVNKINPRHWGPSIATVDTNPLYYREHRIFVEQTGCDLLSVPFDPSKDDKCINYMLNRSNWQELRPLGMEFDQRTVKFEVEFKPISGGTEETTSSIKLATIIKVPQRMFPYEAFSEVAAFHADRVMKINRVPPTTILWIPISKINTALDMYADKMAYVEEFLKESGVTTFRAWVEKDFLDYTKKMKWQQVIADGSGGSDLEGELSVPISMQLRIADVGHLLDTALAIPYKTHNTSWHRYFDLVNQREAVRGDGKDGGGGEGEGSDRSSRRRRRHRVADAAEEETTATSSTTTADDAAAASSSQLTLYDSFLQKRPIFMKEKFMGSIVHISEIATFDMIIGNDDRSPNKNNFVVGGCKESYNGGRGCADVPVLNTLKHPGPPTFVHLDQGMAFYQTPKRSALFKSFKDLDRIAEEGGGDSLAKIPFSRWLAVAKRSTASDGKFQLQKKSGSLSSSSSSSPSAGSPPAFCVFRVDLLNRIRELAVLSPADDPPKDDGRGPSDVKEYEANDDENAEKKRKASSSSSSSSSSDALITVENKKYKSLFHKLMSQRLPPIVKMYVDGSTLRACSRRMYKILQLYHRCMSHEEISPYVMAP